jgi:hypothetical protein
MSAISWSIFAMSKTLQKSINTDPVFRPSWRDLAVTISCATGRSRSSKEVISQHD